MNNRPVPQARDIDREGFSTRFTLRRLRLSPRAILILALIETIVYIILFPPLFGALGDITHALLVLPVAMIAGLFGLRAGVLAALLTLPINVLLRGQMTGAFWSEALSWRTLFGLLVYVGIAVLISKLRTVFARTLRLSSRLRLFGWLIDESSSEVYVFDAASLLCIHASKGALCNLGYSIAQLRQLTASDLMLNVSTADIRRLAGAVITDQGVERSFQTVVSRQDSSTYPIEGRFFFVGDEHPPVFIMMAYDITERVRAEDALRQANNELEFRVVERTTELKTVNERLQHELTERKQAEEAVMAAKKEADRANRAKSEFLSRMSHELRTPLNAILGFAQVLEFEELSPDERDSVEHILRAGRHLLGLINEVLEISRIEAGRVSLSIEPVEVQALLQETLDLLQPLAAPAQVRLPSGLPAAADCYVLADRQRLKQVLLNLLANAVKYNREGGSVELACQAGASECLRILVRDTGMGIPADQFDRLFTPFDRLGAEQTMVEGSGLGLALARQMVEVMGGTLGVESTLGEGSTFWVELPQASTPLERLAVLAAEVAETTHVMGAGATVLYIEDNLVNLQLIERLVARRTGVRLVAAMQGRLGLELAREHLPDVILLDLHLPDLPGREVLAELQAEAATRDIPVVVISADATPPEIEQLLATGARAYLTKPLDIRQFLAVLDETLQHVEAHGARQGRER